MWLMVPLGNPGANYDVTRHNFGRLVLTRWMRASGCPHPKVVRRLRHGDIYSLGNSIHILIANTYMNLSGIACAEAVAVGYDPHQIVIIYDDKDLPLGLGRFRLTGSDGGHNGLKSVIEMLRCRDFPRLRLGIGPFQRPLVDFVMGKWTRSELGIIVTVSAAFSHFMELLQDAENLSTLAGTVNTMAFWTSTAS
jgi:PTH1 family peptidyl-tRNA hydrolase